MAPSSSSRLRFEAPARLVRPARAWLAFPVAFAVAAAACLAVGSPFFLFASTAAAVALGIGFARRPTALRPTVVRVDGEALYAGPTRLAATRDVVGMSVVASRGGRLLAIARRDGAAIELVLDDDVHVAELRAAIGLVMARTAVATFRAHAPLGCFAFAASLAIGLGGSAWLVAHVPSRFFAPVTGVLVPALLVGAPLLVARLKRVTITCGEEAIVVDRPIGRRVLPSRGASATIGVAPNIVVLHTADARALAFELPSPDDAQVFVRHVALRAAAPLGDGDRDVAELLARGARDAREWLASIHAQAAPSNEAYRARALPEERLWAVLEDPGADPSARVGAAVALRAQTRGPRVAELDQRVRIAAGTTALPGLRDALVTVADTPDDATLPERLARVLA